MDKLQELSVQSRTVVVGDEAGAGPGIDHSEGLISPIREHPVGLQLILVFQRLNPKTRQVSGSPMLTELTGSPPLEPMSVGSPKAISFDSRNLFLHLYKALSAQRHKLGVVCDGKTGDCPSCHFGSSFLPLGSLSHFFFHLVPSILQPSAEAGANLDLVTLALELVAGEF